MSSNVIAAIAILSPIIMGMILIPVIFISIRKKLKQLPQQQSALEELTIAMRGTYRGAGILDEYKGSLPKLARPIIRDCIEGQIGDSSARFYKYSVGGGSEQSFYTIFEVTIRGTFPHIYLDSKNGESLGEPLFSRKDRVKLEGVEFAKYFNVYVQDGAQRELLQLFEPSIMAHLIDVVPNINIEFVDNKIYFYINEELAESKEIHDAYQAISNMVIKLAPELNNLGVDDKHISDLKVVAHTKDVDIVGKPVQNFLVQVFGTIAVLALTILIARNQRNGSHFYLLFVAVGIANICRAVYVFIRTGKS